jgi:predicted nucleic acid-binding protein
LLICWPAVTEAIYLLGFSAAAQQALLERVESDAPRVLSLDRSDLPRVRELMQKYADRGMDFADAALVRVAERERITTVFTVDRTDFAVYRLYGRRRFRVIP